MTEKRKPNAAVSTFADHEVIMPPNKLRKAVVKVRPEDVRFAVDPVARAEAALAELAAEFAGWMNQECARLHEARAAIRKDGMDSDRCGVLFRVAHDIKGQAATFGYPLVAPVAESLCRLIEHTPEMTRIPLALVDQHVDAIRAIVRSAAGMKTDATAVKLAERLRQVTDEFLMDENRFRPDYLEQIFPAPSIAPEEPGEPEEVQG